MRERVGHCSAAGAEGMWISTFHSACVRILRREAENVRLHARASRSTTRATRARCSSASSRSSMPTRSASRSRASPAKISKLKNELTDVETLRAHGEPQRPAGGDVPRDLPAVHARAARGERLRLRRPDRRRRSSCSGPSRRWPRSTSAGSATSWSTSTRTRTTRSTRSSASSPCRRAGIVDELEQQGST